MQRRSIVLIGRIVLALFLFCWLLPTGIAGAGAMSAHGARASAGQQAHAGAKKADKSKATAAGPSLHLSASTVSAGDTIAITGTGFMANAPLSLQLVATSTGGMSETYSLASLRANGAGSFVVHTVTIPASAPGGDYMVLVASLNPKVNEKADAPLTIRAAKPTITVDTKNITPNDTIKVSGTKFGKNETVTISMSTPSGSASVPIGQAKTDASGDFSGISIHVPFGVPSGKLDLVATGNTSNLVASTPVVVNAPTAKITLSTGSVLPGDKITITGTHFQPGETVTVDLVTLSSSSKLGTATANQAGQFTLSGVTIPSATPEGTVSVVATGDASKLSATSQIKIGAHAATLTLSAGTVKAGSTLNVKGTGFVPGETISVVVGGGSVKPLTLAAAIAGTDGSFSISNLTVPTSIPAGAYTLTASGQTSGRSATSRITVEAPPPSAPILSVIGIMTPQGQPVTVSPGGFVQLAGSSFPHGAKVTLFLVGSNTRVTLATVDASGSGTFGPLGLTIPAVTSSGSYSLEAEVNGSKVATLPLHVVLRTPHITASTGTLVAGQVVSVSGTGFAPGEQIVLALSGAALQTTPSTVLANGNGAFSAKFTVPATITNGANTLTAMGVTSRAATTLTLHASLGVASRWYFANGDTTGDHRTVISMLNPTGAVAHVKMRFLYESGPESQYTQVVPAHSVASVDLALAAGAGRRISTILEADQKISATSTITYGGADSASTAGASGPSKLWYLAEGYDNGSFTEELVIMNPSSSNAIIDVRFLPFNNRPIQETRFVMQPHSNIRIDAAQYIARQSFATIVTADQNVVVERAMRFGAGGRGADDKIGINSAATVWDFAYGESGADRQTFFTILNPNQASPAAVTATFFDHSGKPIGTQTIVIDALHRGNIKLNDVLANAQVATVLTSNVPIVAERPVYQSSPNLSTAPSGGVVFGRNSGGLAWAFPGLSNGNGDVAHLYLFNPGIKPVTVQATFYTTTGSSQSQTLTLPANSDYPLDVSSISGLPTGAIGAILKSTNGQTFISEQTVLNAGAQRFSSMEGIAQ